MMRTSGIYADSYDAVRYCGVENSEGETCYFEGDVEVTFDTEYGVYSFEWWTCPLCGYEHEEEDD